MRIVLHPKQGKVHKSEATEILFGGAAGPGKSYLLRAEAIIWAALIPGLQVYLFRRTYPELWMNHMMGPGSFLELLAEWIVEGRVKVNYTNGIIDFWNGSRILLRHCQHAKDVTLYQGAQIHLLLVDELTQWEEPMYRFLRSRARLGGLKIPEKWVALFPRIILGANPGGIGHTWVKATFVDIGPWTIKRQETTEGGMLRQFIPARLRDNPTMTATDPDYAEKLSGLGNPDLVKAMLDGDWNIAAGAMFSDLWRGDKLIIEPFAIPASWTIRRSFDWGSSKPFSVGWWGESDGATKVGNKGLVYPKGTAFRIAEWYGWNGKPDQGVRATNAEMARGIIEREKAMKLYGRVQPGPADPSIYAVENGRSIAADMELVGVRWERAQTGPGSRVTGWQKIRERMKASLTWPMEGPGVFVFSTCAQSIRIMPVLPRDTRNQDDVDSVSEDH
jgi:hypothetical protein